jgi:hypothetical protein
MTTPGYKALCAELLDELDFQTSHHELIDLKGRARAALAEEAVGPTTQQLNDLICDQLGYEHYRTGNNSQYELCGTLEDLRSLAVAAIARWGCPADAPRPIPVAERLPTEADCDAEGRCWFSPWHQQGYAPNWRLIEPYLRHFSDAWWLPAAAIPLPAQEGADG